MISIDNDQLAKKLLFIHYAVLYILWACYQIIISPWIKDQSIILFNILNPTIKLLVWTLPVVLILKFAQQDVLGYLKMSGMNKTSFKWGLAASCLIILFHLLMKKLFFSHFYFNPSFTFFTIDNWISGVILVGFTEEVLFRGYFLQRLEGYYSFEIANLLTSLLFLCIHFPIWYAHHASYATGLVDWIRLAAFIFGISFVKGYILKSSRSLWPCIMMHSANNFIVMALVTVN
jgi:membrane protease YdiL (CAAX protease family)